MTLANGKPVVFDDDGKAVPFNRVKKRLNGQAKALLTGFKGANDENLQDWAFLPLEINTILRNDLQKLRARSRDLARNDDTTRRFLSLLKQNVLGHRGIILQAKNKLRNGKPDKKWNAEIEREWKAFGSKRRYRGQSISPSACGQMSWRQIQWLVLMSRAVDGECFIQILRGYPHNRHRYAVRFLNPDLLDSTYSTDETENGNRVDMGIELDEFNRPVAYHFSESHPTKKYATTSKEKTRIPADQILHVYRKEHVGQLRGIPDFAAVMHKIKMLNGVHEAIVVGWRVAAAKMGFFVSKESEDFPDPSADPDDEYAERQAPENSFDATPGSFDYITDATDFKQFDVDYPTSTYGEGYKVFMRQLSNGLNVSSPTLSNDYSDVNYSSLRQALLEDREGWRCVQAEMEDDFERPMFDDWYDWTNTITQRFNITAAKRAMDPVVEAIPRGWPWVDPLKEVKAQVEAIGANLRTRQSIMADNNGADFMETVDTLRDEQEALAAAGLVGSVVAEDDDEQAMETTDDE
jgi:lambda family phage portal protein